MEESEMEIDNGSEGKPCRLVRFAGYNLARLLVGCRYFLSPTLHLHVNAAFLSTRDVTRGCGRFKADKEADQSQRRDRGTAPRASLMVAGVGAALRRSSNRSAARFGPTRFLAAIAV